MPTRAKPAAAGRTARRSPSGRASARPKQPASPSSPSPARLIVAMGASAGGLEAFERFFLHMPSDSGLVFVVVPHLDAHHKSAMAELLARYTRMPVVEITRRHEAAADRIHVIPPNATLTMQGDRFRLETPRSHSSTIDSFFMSLAEQHGEDAVGIILSGSGSDGSAGLKAIKEHGGLTMAQAGEILALRQHAAQRHRHRPGRLRAAGRGDAGAAGPVRPRSGPIAGRTGRRCPGSRPAAIW